MKLFSQDRSNKVKGETFSLLAQVCKPQILCGHSLIWCNYMMIVSYDHFVFKSSLMWDCFQASLSKVQFFAISLQQINYVLRCVNTYIVSGGWVPKGYGGDATT